MAHPPLTPLEAWRKDWATLRGVPSLRQVKERLSVVGTVDWSEPPAQVILRQWMDHLNFERNLSVSLKHLDVMTAAGALPLGWALPLSTTVRYPSCLAVRLLDSLGGRPDTVAHAKWVDWAMRALKETPAQTHRLDSVLQERLLGRLWCVPAHRPVLEAACLHHPRPAQEPKVREQLGKTETIVWANRSVTEEQWSWMLDHGVNPHHAVPGHRPFWWLACEQQCEAAWSWIKATDPVQAEHYRVFRYFRTLAQPTHLERSVFEQYEARLFGRPDWATVKNESGRSAVWHLAHHHVEWLCHQLPPYLLAIPDWRASTDEAGRNLAVAVLAYTGSNPNGYRETALRRLAQENVVLGPDGAGRGVMISLPDLKTEKLGEAMHTYGHPSRWWQGTSEQVDVALRHVAQTPSTWVEWARALKAVPSENPVLRGAEWILTAAQGLPFTPHAQPMTWPFALDNSPVMEKALASPHGVPLLALRQASLALTLTPSRSRPRARA